VTEHGSALNFSVRRSPELVPFAVEGLAGAAAVVAVSDGARTDLVAWAAEQGLHIADKTLLLGPGIDTECFKPAPDREAALDALRAAVDLPDRFELRPDDAILAFAGSLRATKGIQYAEGAMPLIASGDGRRVRLLVAGDGPARRALEELSRLLDAGEYAQAVALTAREAEVGAVEGWGPVVVEPAAASAATFGGAGGSAAFLGHLSHRQLAAVFAAADVSLAPSVFPEAAALVNVEALAAGALPLATYHSGLVSLVDFIAESLADPAFSELAPGTDLTPSLAGLIARVLDRYPTRDPEFRSRVHEMALRRFATWEAVARRYVGFASAQ
jgi:glycosyltransferase involved in cell wall biosynthesis